MHNLVEPIERLHVDVQSGLQRGTVSRMSANASARMHWLDRSEGIRIFAAPSRINKNPKPLLGTP
jgi:hypothetical protein